MLSLYSEKHPFFLNSAEALQKKIRELFIHLCPFKFGVTSNYLMLEGKPLEKSGLYDELARILHRRKIKSIEIKKEVSREDLACFLSKIHLSPKQIFSNGGIEKILREEKISSICVEELDYSQLLSDGTEECRDIWAFLLGEAVEKKDSRRISELADNVEKILANFKIKDFFEDEETKKNILGFLNYLKEHNKEKFRKGLKAVLKLVLRERTLAYKDRMAQLEAFFKGLSADDFAEILSEEILGNDNFDAVGLNLFFLLADEKRHEEIIDPLGRRLRAKGSLMANPRIRKKIADLFSLPADSPIAGMYRGLLLSMIKDSADKVFCFDRKALDINYQYLLLNLLDREVSAQGLGIILEKIVLQWENIAQCKEPGYLKNLSEVIKRNKRENPSSVLLFKALDSRIAGFLENAVLNSRPFEGMEDLLEGLEQSALRIEAYLEKIFNKREVDVYLLKLLLKFFPGQMNSFYQRLEKEYGNLEFLKKIIDTLKIIGTKEALTALKNIYAFSNNLIKIEVLRAMQALALRDREFLFSVLEKEEIALKKEALIILVEDEKTKKKALDFLLAMPNPFGKRNKLILDNILVVEEAGLREATEYLLRLSRSGFLFCRSVRKKSTEVLRKWNVRKD